MNSVLRCGGGGRERSEFRSTGMGVLRPPFVPLDECRAVRIYQRNLPHWRQEGVTYFVTFREGDSIPEAVRCQWEEEKALWLKARRIAYDGERGQWRQAFEKLPAA